MDARLFRLTSFVAVKAFWRDRELFWRCIVRVLFMESGDWLAHWIRRFFSVPCGHWSAMKDRFFDIFFFSNIPRWSERDYEIGSTHRMPSSDTKTLYHLHGWLCKEALLVKWLYFIGFRLWMSYCGLDAHLRKRMLEFADWAGIHRKRQAVMYSTGLIMQKYSVA